MRLISLLKRLNPQRSPTVCCYSTREEAPLALRSLKGKSTRNTVQYYVDVFRVRCVGGRGGDGCVSFLHAWCKENGGPDGGDGGNGGHVILQATHTVRSLNHLSTVVQAAHGGKGTSRDCCGKSAPHTILPVPLGTIVKTGAGAGAGAGRVVGSLEAEGHMFVAARGGAGGRGNRFFLTDTEQAPDIAEVGAEGETASYTVEVRSMAHVGLIGFPNAGKSSLLRAISRARPKVAPYAFTTLRPHIGVVPYDDYEQVSVADLPGLIPGSHRNHGLGVQFLQHAERCAGLLYILDGACEDPAEQYRTLRRELSLYSPALAARPAYLLLNKVDLPSGTHSLARLVTEWDRVVGVSAKTGQGIQEVLRIIRRLYDERGTGKGPAGAGGASQL